MRVPMAVFSRDLLRWYDDAKRKLPWRETSDPYAILVSELMLQQTQVQTVIPYFERFMARFPNPRALAEADESAVLKAWQGLGYYRRARHLQAAARQIAARHGGRFPAAEAEILALKGVGDYTGAAVASIAFGIARACVDGNVIRVISRLFAIDEDVGRAAVKRAIAERAQGLIDEDRPGDFNQAMMELGATICTPRAPACLACPVSDHCRTFAAGDDPQRRPYKAKRVQASKASFDGALIVNDGRFLAARRPDEGLMAGMWELPYQPAETARPWPALFADPLTPAGALPEVAHRFTHLHAVYRVSVFRCPRRPEWRGEPPRAYADFRWIDATTLAELPQTKVLQRQWPHIESALEETPLCPSEPSNSPGLPLTS